MSRGLLAAASGGPCLLHQFATRRRQYAGDKTRSTPRVRCVRTAPHVPPNDVVLARPMSRLAISGFQHGHFSSLYVSLGGRTGRPKRSVPDSDTGQIHPPEFRLWCRTDSDVGCRLADCYHQGSLSRLLTMVADPGHVAISKAS